MTKQRIWLQGLGLLLIGVTSRAIAAAPDWILSPCDQCEAALAGLPADPQASVGIAPASEPGERLRVDGVVRDRSGQPRAGVVIYAQQTNAEGLYPGAGTDRDPGVRAHGRLRGWVRSDAQGRYTLHTVRPGHYPDTTLPQHIHLYVIQPGCALYYIDDVQFTDDPHLAPALARHPAESRGGSGVVTPQRTDDGWQVRRDIVLGLNVAGYPACGDAG